MHLVRMSWMPGHLDDRAHRAAGDDAGTRRRPACSSTCPAPKLADDAVGDGAPFERDLEQVLLGLLGALADRLGHLVGLAERRADVAVLVADDDQRGEAEAPAALDDLGHAVDVDDAVDRARRPLRN